MSGFSNKFRVTACRAAVLSRLSEVMELVRNLNGVNNDDTASAGGKGASLVARAAERQVMSGAHSALEPRLPIPNRTVKRAAPMIVRGIEKPRPPCLGFFASRNSLAKRRDPGYSTMADSRNCSKARTGSESSKSTPRLVSIRVRICEWYSGLWQSLTARST